MNFKKHFELLTGNEPFPWQQKLYSEFIERRCRDACPIPTGLGKTSIIAIWILALAHHARNGTLTSFPRRLVYVVNRRTVVDQSTREAVAMREALDKPELREITDALQLLQVQDDGIPLAISTLRGQFADNAEWRNDPARPAVIVGTVDMIGSRLLFSGYGCGFKSRPLHAGFLGQDTLLVHDEAHLEPAFQQLIKAIEREQQQYTYERGKFHVMELTATTRTAGRDEEPIFTGEDKNHPVAEKRFFAKKWIQFHSDSKAKIADKVGKIAKSYKDCGKPVLVFLREVKDVYKVAEQLRKATSAEQVQTLTGTMRGWERDRFVKEDPVFARFIRDPQVTPRQGTVYLICTSAGEVGVDLTTDFYMVCDLTALDSMMQRFGRVNRFGDGEEALIDVVHVNSEGMKKLDSLYDRACAQTLAVLKNSLGKRESGGGHDASLAALEKIAEIPVDDRRAAFTPPPAIRPATDIFFDALSLTSIRQNLPGRPSVAELLHGIEPWEPPVTYVAWREEVDLVTDDILGVDTPEDLLGDFPIKPHELLRDNSKRVFDEMEKIVARDQNCRAWLIDRDGDVRAFLLRELLAEAKSTGVERGVADCTILLPPRAGGLLLKSGLLEGDLEFNASSKTSYDIADEWLDGQQRRRIKGEHQKPKGMRLVRIIDITNTILGYEDDEEPGTHLWYWYTRPKTADDDGSSTSREEQTLDDHLLLALKFVKKLTAKLDLGAIETEAVIRSSGWHDKGKAREVWQWSIGNFAYPQAEPLAKSNGKMRAVTLSGYRHEFGTLLDLDDNEEFNALHPDIKDLILHFVAAHHGRGRPNFPEHEVIDHERDKNKADEIAVAVAQRFARLQRKYGRWGLAYLESLVRAADIMASQSGDNTKAGAPDEASAQGGE